MPLHTGNSVAPLERRLHVRQRLDAIAYLDIGPDNGGIVLNVSEEGMAVQVVGFLDKKEDLSFRVKLPNSQRRIELTARIVWLNETSRRAGVRFLATRPEAHVEIQEWIRSQTSASGPLVESPKLAEEATQSGLKQKTIREPQRNKWLGLKPEFEFPELSRQKPPEAAVGVTHLRVPPAQEDHVEPQEPEIVVDSPSDPEKPPSVGRPTMQEESSQAADFQTPVAYTRLEPDGGDAPIAAPSHDDSRDSTLAWPSPISHTSAIATPIPPDLPHKPVELFTSQVESETNSTPASVKTMIAFPAAAYKMIAWNRVAIAVFFAFCSVLCFGIGTWVGQFVTRRHSPNAAVAPVNVVQTTEPAKNEIAGRDLPRLAPATAEKAHTGTASGRTTLEKRKFAPSMISPDVAPVSQSTAPNPRVQDVTTSETTKEQESNPPVAPARRISMPPEQSEISLAGTREEESNPMVAAARENSASTTSSPRIVGGLILKPSDRFNPCHLTYRVQPAYPPEAQEQQIEGVVKIQQVIGADGIVHSVKLLSGPPLLVPAALEAARYWRYLPALLNGQPVETQQDVEIEFRLPN